MAVGEPLHHLARGLDELRLEAVLDAAGKLQDPEPERRPAAPGARDEPVLLEVGDQPVGGAGGQVAAPGELARQQLAGLRERPEQRDDAVEHLRAARGAILNM